jgi:soluble lytic murein transglycosylase-like protein
MPSLITTCLTALRLLPVGALAFLMGANADAAAIYKFRDRNGVVTYTNIKPNHAAQVVMVYCPACDPTSKVDFSRVPIKTSSFNSEIAAAIAKNPVDEALVRAIIQAESAYNPFAISKAGARGLMQLMPATGAQYGVSDFYNPTQNIQGGVAYLRFLLDMFDGDITLTAAGYNSGENNVLKYAGVPPFAETQVYVKRVGQLYQRYRAEIAARDAKPASPVTAPTTTIAAKPLIVAPIAAGATTSNPSINASVGSPARQ